MDCTLFPKNFPDVGGLSFEFVATSSQYEVFCDFVRSRMENCTGLFREFQSYLVKRNGPVERTVHKPNQVHNENPPDGS